MLPDEVVRHIWDYKHNEEEPGDVVMSVIEKALCRWQWKGQPADNIAVVIAFLAVKPKILMISVIFYSDFLIVNKLAN